MICLALKGGSSGGSRCGDSGGSGSGVEKYFHKQAHVPSLLQVEDSKQVEQGQVDEVEEEDQEEQQEQEEKVEQSRHVFATKKLTT